jgi:hypothetical protein
MRSSYELEARIFSFFSRSAPEPSADDLFSLRLTASEEAGYAEPLGPGE